MHNGAEESKIQEYTKDDLPEFFEKRSKAISEKFSNERFKISTIRSKKIGDHNEFSFNLKLLPTHDKNTVNKEQFLVTPVVDFFRIYLSHGDYKVRITVPPKSKKLYDIHFANNSYNPNYGLANKESAGNRRLFGL